MYRVAKAVRGCGADLVHAHLGTASTLAPLAARLVGWPSVCTLHHVPKPLHGREAARERLSVAVASRSRGLIFVSHASRQGFAARYRCNPKTWTVIRNGVELTRFRPRASSEHPGLPADLAVPANVPIVTLVGHMRPGKGQRVAIEAWPEVLRSNPTARLLLVGNGPEQPGLCALADRLGVRERVVFAGARDDVEVLLRGSTLAVLPTELEALPTALIEAAACGVPAVATRVGGVPEVVVDGRTGWLVDAPRPALFAAALCAALSDRARLRTMGQVARQHAERHFDARRWADRLASAYQTAAAGRAIADARLDGAP